MDYKIRFATADDHDLIYALKKEFVRSYEEKIWGWDEDFQRKDFENDYSAIRQFNVVEADVKDAIRFLRAREIVHYQRFGAANSLYKKLTIFFPVDSMVKNNNIAIGRI